jgi:hypothetical protein
VIFPDFQPMRVSEELVAFISFSKMQFLPSYIWDLPFMSYRLCCFSTRYRQSHYALYLVPVSAHAALLAFGACAQHEPDPDESVDIVPVAAQLFQHSVQARHTSKTRMCSVDSVSFPA